MVQKHTFVQRRSWSLLHKVHLDIVVNLSVILLFSHTGLRTHEDRKQKFIVPSYTAHLNWARSVNKFP